MNTNIKIILTGLVGLLIGIGGTFAALQERNGDDDGHRMTDGSMMHGSMNGMQGEMDSMMQGLSGKTGDAFDQAFLSEMIMHHQGAVAMAEAALKDARHQEIKDLAKNIISAQNTEIKGMQDWEKAWYGK